MGASIHRGMIRQLPGLDGVRRMREAAQFFAATLPVLRRATGLKILFQRHGGLGDVICTFPAVLALRQKFPGATIVYRVLPSLTRVVEMAGVADVIVPTPNWIDPPPRLCRGLFDVVLQPYLEDERPTGKPQDEAQVVHLVDAFCAKAGVTTSKRQPRLAVPPGLSARIRSQLFASENGKRVLIAIHSSPAWRIREWTDGGWQELVSWLVREHHALVVQLGDVVHRKEGAVNATRIPGALDCVGKFSLEETAACMQACELFVGVDSGPLHMAGAVGTPCVGLFGAVDPALRLPPETPSIGVVADVPCLGCHHRLPIVHWQDNCPAEIACMRSLPVGRVAAACDQLLKENRRRDNLA
jgi:ADP-heptose:LPS heptosyltransferase